MQSENDARLTAEAVLYRTFKDLLPLSSLVGANSGELMLSLI